MSEKICTSLLCLGGDADVEDGNLDNYIYFLRRRFRTLKTKAKITTIHGIGYKLEAAEEK